MKALVALVLTIAISVTEGIRWPVPYARDVLKTGRFGFDDEQTSSFQEVPSSQFDTRFNKFKLVEIDDSRPVKWHCLDQDVSYCVGYDYCGNIAAIQIGYLKEYAVKVDPYLYNFANNTNFKEKVWFNRSIYAVEIWLTDPEKLTENGRNNLDEIIEGLWAHVNGKWLRFDYRCQGIGPSIGDFYLQGCLPQKGTIYIYNLHKYSTCRDGFFLFLYYDRGSLVGFGHGVPGYFPPGPTREWFNYPKGEKFTRLIPSPPSCLSSLLDYGVTSTATFLIDEPLRIRCRECAS